ncbi:MotE family protein [Falsiruegeria mediterranea]|uniref:Uncharacterized protein n=1 Tax=Falsiruegeria mediterranea M17 TaxID=1200281 RepID=A0A2R8C3E6_9RHOB|nr:hypothetical protein [Falsiruegeria mediterranea]SPJ26906.1 hypothetical protein TRM7615_00375 [Falsiruegeria mediterranea M17]
MSKPITARNGALTVIAVLMLGSAVLRVGFEAGPAIAREINTEQPEALKDEMFPKVTETAVEYQKLLAALQEREQNLARRESQIEERAKALAVADEAIEQKLAALTEAEEALRETIALADVAAEDDLTRLTDVYEQMKPKESAALFEEMDPDFAAGFLARMRPEAAAGIMAGLSPTAAYTISVVLAGRNANVPDD